MENILVKYSEFFQDDGGFDTLKKDFVKLGDELVDEAGKIKKKVNDALSLGDADEIEKQEKATEELLKTYKKFGDARESINKVEEEFQRLQRTGNSRIEDQIDALTQLDKSLNTYRSDLRKANTSERQGIKTGEDLNRVRVEAQLNIKTTQTEIRRLQKEILDSNKLSKEEQKLLRAKITLEKEEIENITDIRERLAALRLVRNQVNITTEEGTEQVAEYNKEIDELTDLLSDNSDKFVQNKINVGNYEESIVNALKSQQAFTTGLGALDGALSAILGLLLLNKEELDELEKATKNNTNAIKRFAIAFGRLNKVLKASIIGVVLLAIAALSSAFGNTRAGAVRLEKIMTSVSSAFISFGRIAGSVFSFIGESFVTIFDTIKNLSSISLKDLFTGNVDFSEIFLTPEEGFNRLKDLISEISDIASQGSDAIVKGLENIDRAFALEDRVRRLNQEIARLNGQLSLAQQIADDSTKSLSTQLLANQKALELSEQIGRRQVEIAKSQLEAANERVKQNILANGVEASNINLGLQGQAFAKATLDLAERRGVQLELSNELLEEQQDLVLGVIEAENDLELTRAENARQQREIQRDLFEQNLDLLIDLIDTEKNISDQFVNDVGRNFQRRINEFNRFLIRFRVNAQKELDEFTKFAQQSGLDLDFQVAFDEDGNVQVFVNDTQLATDNIVELNKQLQGLGLNEITINRFREFIIESRNGVRDFRDLNKELILVGINVRELRENLTVSQDEINALTSLQQRINQLIARSRGNIGQEERKQILKDLEELEKQKTAIAKFGEFQRLQNRKDAINAELQTVEEGSQREVELKQELLDIEKKLLEQGIDDNIDAVKEATTAGVDRFKRFAEDLNRLTGLILDALLEVNQQRIDESEERVDRQEDQVERQEERARLGLQNTLAFEQRELAKREAELLKQQQRQERFEKLKSLYASYSNYASRGDENPILKTLRDFAILESIAASFKEGGITGVDGVKTNRRGITVGASHDPNGRGGNLAWHESGEGFLSRKSIKNMGQDNFYKLKQLTESGPLSENFFSGQSKNYLTAIPIQMDNSKSVQAIKEVTKAIQQKPVPDLDIEKTAEGIIDLVKTVKTKNKTVRHHYRIDKRRL